MANKNVTFIEDLMDIENQPSNIRKFVRPTVKANIYQGGNQQEDEQYFQQQSLQNSQPSPAPQKEKENAPRLNCLDIAEHVKNCPLCTKFYDSDKTVYIILIIVLSVITLLLLKKVLEI